VYEAQRAQEFEEKNKTSDEITKEEEIKGKQEAHWRRATKAKKPHGHEDENKQTNERRNLKRKMHTRKTKQHKADYG
jgi:hypothetical protein